MKNLTINQIILLLDIYRGTNTQKSMGTLSEDVRILVYEGYAQYEDNVLKITDKGVNFATATKDIQPLKDKITELRAEVGQLKFERAQHKKEIKAFQDLFNIISA